MIGGTDTRRPAVFLDRDGTMIEDVGYLNSLDRVTFFPWTIDAIRALNRAGLPVVVVTNQSGSPAGSDRSVRRHRIVSSPEARPVARVDAYYYCPHHPDGKVEAYALRRDCRKPGRGDGRIAPRTIWGLDLARSFVVGDTRWTSAGPRDARHPRSRSRRGVRRACRRRADVVVDNLAAAASWIFVEL